MSGSELLFFDRRVAHISNPFARSIPLDSAEKLEGAPFLAFFARSGAFRGSSITD
jgi:hypothetical protein